MHIGEHIIITGMCNYFKVDSNLSARDWDDLTAGCNYAASCVGLTAGDA